jgi:hypothetical protein
MYELIGLILFVALLGAVCLPVTLAVLARLGLFEPFEISVLGKRYTFAPKVKKFSSFSSGTMSIFPNRQMAFAGAVSVVLTIGASGIQSSATVTGSGGTLTIKEAT